MSASLFLKDPAFARFVAGGLAEVEALLGSPLPSLPPTRAGGGRSVFPSTFHSHLRALLERHLEALLAQIGAAGAGARARGRDVEAEYEAALGAGPAGGARRRPAAWAS